MFNQVSSDNSYRQQNATINNETLSNVNTSNEEEDEISFDALANELFGSGASYATTSSSGGYVYNLPPALSDSLSAPSMNQQSNFTLIGEKVIALDDCTDEESIDQLQAELFSSYSESHGDEEDCSSEIDDNSDSECDMDEWENKKCSGDVCGNDFCSYRKHKSTDEQLKSRVFEQSLFKFSPCNKTICPYGGQCVDGTTIKDTRKMSEHIWRGESDDAPSTADRRLMYVSILRLWHQNDVKVKKEGKNTDTHLPFIFYAGQKSANNRRICEGAFLILSGISQSPNPSEAPTQWRNAKKYVLSGLIDQEDGFFKTELFNERYNIKNMGLSLKFEHARAFIRDFVDKFGDTVPTSAGGDKVLRIAPFADLKSFHEEYKYHNAELKTPANHVAKLTTFQNAYKSLKSEGIRKLKSKGSFNTCEICNNASDLLRNRHKKLKPTQREVIQRFRQCHLSQQAKERLYLEERKTKAADLDEFGQPKRMLLFADGMTQYTCQTPKFPHASKGDRTLESRIVGVEVYCGEIKTVFVYRMDGLIPMGANIMIEVLRQAIVDLCLKLRQSGKRTPKTLWLQFDNCGENKNKEMFAYLSLLVESFVFKTVEVCFLIVGHTHASIDQYFSVISKAIKRAEFIGSPLALLDLIRRAHNASWDQEAVVRDICVYYDVAKSLGPYINTNIKHYQVPHHFLIEQTSGGVATMRYKMFCSSDVYLPIAPACVVNSPADVLDKQLDSVELSESLAVIGSSNELLRQCGYHHHSDSEEVLKDKSSIAIAKAVQDTLSVCEGLSNLCIEAQEDRMRREAESLTLLTSYAKYKSHLKSEMRKSSDATHGFIVWLDKSARAKTSQERPPIESIAPVPFDPAMILSGYKMKELDESLGPTVPMGDEGRVEYILENDVSSPPVCHQPSEISSGKGDVSTKDAKARRFYAAAKAIASSATWVLSLLGVGGRLLVSNSREFSVGENFKSLTITVEELQFYSNRDTVDKVIAIASREYANAAKWCPLPVDVLSTDDIELIAREQALHITRIKEAEALANRLMVRPGHNAPVTQEILERPGTSDHYLSNLLSEKKNEKKNARDDTSQPAGIAKRAKIGEGHYLCDVAECNYIARAGEQTCNEKDCTANKYRFCFELHLAHDSHKHHNKRKQRTKFKTPTHPSAVAVQPSAVAVTTTPPAAVVPAVQSAVAVTTTPPALVVPAVQPSTVAAPAVFMDESAVSDVLSKDTNAVTTVNMVVDDKATPSTPTSFAANVAPPTPMSFSLPPLTERPIPYDDFVQFCPAATRLYQTICATQDNYENLMARGGKIFQTFEERIVSELNYKQYYTAVRDLITLYHFEDEYSVIVESEWSKESKRLEYLRKFARKYKQQFMKVT